MIWIIPIACFFISLFGILGFRLWIERQRTADYMSLAKLYRQMYYEQCQYYEHAEMLLKEVVESGKTETVVNYDN